MLLLRGTRRGWLRRPTLPTATRCAWS